MYDIWVGEIFTTKNFFFWKEKHGYTRLSKKKKRERENDKKKKLFFYDKINQLYNVKWSHNNILKFVKRLNLRFENEDPDENDEK